MRGWEGILLDMFKAQKMSFSGGLSQILPSIVSSVSQLSHVFYEFVAKYPIVNFIEGRGIFTNEPVRNKYTNRRGGTENADLGV